MVGVTVQFGGIRALDGASLTVGDHEIVSLIGPNGAGKSTALNVISRIVDPASGSVTIDGVDLLRLPAHRIVEQGIARTYQGLELFPSMTVGETLMAGQHSRTRAGFLASSIQLPSVRREEHRCRHSALEIAALLNLEPHWNRLVPTLPYGSQKRVDIGRALAGRPTLLLLDEPAAGLNSAALDELASLITGIRDQLQLSILLIEHHVSMVMGMSDRVCVLNFGQVIADGAPEDVRRDPAVIEAYLGSPTAADHA